MLAFMTEEPHTDTEHNRSFRTHNGYLAALRYLAFDGRRFGALDYHLGKLADRSLSVYSDQIKPVKIAVDREAVCGCLYRAWGTETILCTTAELSPDADLLRLALAWGAVQAYYACYGAGQAVLVAEGKPRSEQHNTTQNQVVDLWACRRFSLAPWSFAATPTPALFIMAWRISKNTAGRPQTTPSAIREIIAGFYAEKVSVSDVNGYPLLEQLLIHDEAQILSMFQVEQDEDGYVDHFGWSSVDGRFIRFRNGGLVRDKDRTIAALLAALHWAVAEPDFNRFFSYQDEVRDQNVFPYKYAGTSLAWSNLSVEAARGITSRIP
jgi:hypothetical protein